MEPYSGLITELLKLGVTGIFLVYLIVKNYLDGKKYDELAQRLDQIQERRASEREQNATVMLNASEAQRKIADAVADLAERISTLITTINNRRAR